MDSEVRESVTCIVERVKAELYNIDRDCVHGIGVCFHYRLSVYAEWTVEEEKDIICCIIYKRRSSQQYCANGVVVHASTRRLPIML